jgi:hypothetical protein
MDDATRFNATRFDLADGADLLGLPDEQLWCRYLGLGGALSQRELVELVAGRAAGTPVEADIAAHAMNEAFLDLGLGTFPVGYRSPALDAVLRGRLAVDLAERRTAAMSHAGQLRERSAALLHTSSRRRRDAVGR